jgi:hypothetical protein
MDQLAVILTRWKEMIDEMQNLLEEKSPEHVVCSRQLHGGGNQIFYSEHVMVHTRRFFYGAHKMVYLFLKSIWVD